MLAIVNKSQVVCTVNHLEATLEALSPTSGYQVVEIVDNTAHETRVQNGLLQALWDGEWCNVH